MEQSKKDFIINRIENELLLKLIDYVIPFVGKKINKKIPAENSQFLNLESIVNNSKPKISFDDVKELESALLFDVNTKTQVSKNSTVKSKNIFYSLNFIRKKEENINNNYSIEITYEENSNGDKLKISIRNAEKEIYSSEIINKKEVKDKVAPYRLTVAYKDSYGEGRLSITYRQQLNKYLKKHIDAKEDMSERVPLKWVNILPESTMGGVLGFTYIGDPSMGRRADLTGWMARMVDIHESIHTPDEYETRVLTSWIMEKVRSRYVK
ncbi:MAG TPA: hypothetical protein VJJ52_00400 [Candidatus Nanoarchaeia archaeon]|nr:hypothetical protein [Candidatus Nanoarchaeia archaeon]